MDNYLIRKGLDRVDLRKTNIGTIEITNTYFDSLTGEEIEEKDEVVLVDVKSKRDRMQSILDDLNAFIEDAEKL